MKAKAKYNNKDKFVNLKIKRFQWWWFLLLLLPLILLIPINKTVKVQVNEFPNNNPSDGALVVLESPSRMLFNFNTGEFNSLDTIYETQETDEEGNAVFKKAIKTSLYQMLIFPKNKFTVTSSKNCYEAYKEKKIISHFGSKVIIMNMKPNFSGRLNFLVTDKETGEPLVEADVEVIVDMPGFDTIIHDKTGINGEVFIDSIPSCAHITVVGSRYGYYNDTIDGFVDTLANNPSLRELELQPQKEIIRYYIYDSETNQPLPGATGHLYVENVMVHSSVTNTGGNGIFVPGEGQFAETHIIKKMYVYGTHPDYHDSVCPADGSQVTVENFNKRSKENRTVYLRPKGDMLSFRNTVSVVCGIPLSGVTNKIIVKHSDGTTENHTLVSNINGIFEIPGLRTGDIISIVSSRPPDYLDNTKSYTYANLLTMAQSASCQEDIDIPMQLDEPPATTNPTIPNMPEVKCENSAEGGSGDDTFCVNVGKTRGQVNLISDYYGLADQLIVSCGCDANATVIKDFGMRANSHSDMITFICPSGLLKIEVVGNVNKSNTNWEFTIDCMN